MAAHIFTVVMLELPIIDDFRQVLPEHECSYLGDRSAQFDYRVVYDLTAEQYDHLLERGWRRHGLHIFRPVCQGCGECKSLRVPVSHFKPSKSQRRVARRNADVDCIIQSPTITRDHIELFNRYHADMTRRKGWRENSTTPQDYFESFLCGRYEFEREFLYIAGRKLIAVGLVDVTEKSASSVYFYHDPDWRDFALGVFSMIRELDYLRNNGVSYHYLGYWIEACGSMAYKCRYRPNQILAQYVADDETPNWCDFE